METSPWPPCCERVGLDQIKAEIEAESEGIEVVTNVRWLKPWALIARHQPPVSAVLFSVRDKKQAKRLLEGGVRISGRKQAAYIFVRRAWTPSVQSAASGPLGTQV